MVGVVGNASLFACWHWPNTKVLCFNLFYRIKYIFGYFKWISLSILDIGYYVCSRKTFHSTKSVNYIIIFWVKLLRFNRCLVLLNMHSKPFRNTYNSNSNGTPQQLNYTAVGRRRFRCTGSEQPSGQLISK